MKKKKYLAVVSMLVISGSVIGYLSVNHLNNVENKSEVATQKLPKSKTDNEASASDEKGDAPPLRYPNIIGSTFKFEDYSSIDGLVHMRRFIIPYGEIEPIYFQTANQIFFDGKQDYIDKITSLADLDASFGEIFKLDLEPSENWKAIAVHVGDYSQDNCGEYIDIVYTLDNGTVTAMFEDNSNKDLILGDSQCPDISKLRKSESIGHDASYWCNERSKCLKKYLENPINHEKLKSTMLIFVRDLVVE